MKGALAPRNQEADAATRRRLPGGLRVLRAERNKAVADMREALEKQAATAEILRIISSSRGDLQPTFNAIAAHATALSAAAIGVLYQFDGALIHAGTLAGLTAAEIDALRSVFPLPPCRGPATARAILTREIVHIPDPIADPEYPHAIFKQFGTVLSVPMLRGDTPVGAITVSRRHIAPFTTAQIAMVQTFADQAVIAIENARLLGEIRESQAKLRVTFDNIGDGVVMFDAELRLTAWNRNFVEILELPDWFLAAQRNYADYIRYLAERGEFGAVDPEAEMRRYTANAGRQSTVERTRPDGRILEVRHNPVVGGGFVLIYSDISERKEAEAQLRVARDTAEAALTELRATQANLVHAEKMASLGQLTAGIAHEIKNPLNFVNNFASLSVDLLDELREKTAPGIAALGEEYRAEVGELAETLAGNLTRIVEHGDRADKIVKGMLAHSRSGSGDRREVDLNKLIEEALNLAYHGARARDQSFDIALEREFDPALRQIELAPQEMTRVFLNLFDNGFYAAGVRARENDDRSFRPLLTVKTRACGDAVEIRVRDNGTGIRQEIRNKLFQPFFTTKPTGEGTGLGLSISWDIVTRQHGGTIEVDSHPGEFTEFTVRLPRSFGAAPNEKSAVSS